MGLRENDHSPEEAETAADRDWDDAMLELINGTSLTEQEVQAVAKPQPTMPAQKSRQTQDVQAPAPVVRQSTHWTRHFRDPLGEALTRIYSGANRSADETSRSTDNSVAPVAESPAIQVSEASQPAVVHHIEDIPATLPMFGEMQSVAAPSAGNAQKENRRFPRRSSECRVAVVCRDETRDLTPRETDCLLESGLSLGRLQDLCQLGICVLVHKNIPEGTEVLLRMTNEKIGRSVDMSARVVQSQSPKPGIFSLHCQTLREFTLDELQDLGQQPNIPRYFA